MAKIINILIPFITLIFFSNCDNPSKVTEKGDIQKDTIEKISKEKKTVVKDTSKIEKYFYKAGLIKIKSLDSTFIVELKYSTTDNFVGIDMYGELDEAYAQKITAKNLVKAHKLLKDTLPEYRIIIFDAVRPFQVQQIMWDSVEMPYNQKRKYIASPENISMHNFGLAVDVSITDSTGKPIDMGTKFDSFNELSYPILEEKMLKAGMLSQEQYNNRKLLRNIMHKAGFNSISTEWWHFSVLSRKEALANYDIIRDPSKEEVVEPDKQTAIAKITFKIQLKTSMKPIRPDSKIFKGLDIWRYHHENMYKYTTGTFTNLKDAYNHRDKIKAMGFDDCFVAGFKNNKRIGIKQAVELSEE